MVGTTHENSLWYVDSERAIISFPGSQTGMGLETGLTRQEDKEGSSVERACCTHGYQIKKKKEC